MSLRRRVEALESALRPRAEPFADPQYAVLMHREILRTVRGQAKHARRPHRARQS
jgi:hypothetical protein